LSNNHHASQVLDFFIKNDYLFFYIEKEKQKRRKEKNVCECKERERLDGRSIEDSSLSSYLPSSFSHFSFFSLFSVVKKNQKANFSFRKKVELLKKMS